MTKEDRMKKSLSLTALLLAVVIALASAGECVMASTAAGATKASAEKSSEDAVETEETETTAEGEDAEEDDSAEEEETTKAAKKKKKTVKKKGNLDRYIGLDEKYMVLATAKRYVRVYRKMDKSSRVVGAFRKNNCIIMNTESLKEGRQYKWIKVYSKGKSGIGYIPLSWVSLRIIDTETFGLDTSSEKNRQRIKICQYGLPYVGTRFKMGGKSLTQGIDCSTFARQAFRNAGVMVSSSATAWRLSNYGKAISRSELKPGDMLFYPHNAHNLGIGHCAIYIGRGFLINSSGHQGSIYPRGGIRFSRIDYRYPSACKFRNIVGN